MKNLELKLKIKNLVKNLEKIRCLDYPFLNILKNEKLVIIIIIILLYNHISEDLSEGISFLNIMCITQIRNSVPETELKILNTSRFYNYLFENLLSVLQDYPFYKIKDLGKVFVLRAYLFSLVQLSPDKILNYQELEIFREGVLNLLHSNNGYLNKEKLESNKLLNFFRSSSQPDMKLDYNEVQCFYSLIILILLLEYELYTMYYEDLYNRNTEGKESLKIFLSDIKENKRKLRNHLASEFKVLLSKTRINLMNKIYSGFDTEFQMLSSNNNELLAYTTCSYSKQFICIKNLDLGIIESVYKAQLVEMIKILRFLNKKYDVEIDELSTCLSQNKEQIEKIECKEYNLYSKREENLKKLLVTNFYDLEDKANDYSIRELVVRSIESQKSRIDEITEFHQVFLKKVRLPRIPVKKEVCLIAHFTTADVSSLADFQEFKTSFSILRKSFVTLERNIRLEG